MATFRELLAQTKAAISEVDTAGAEGRLSQATFLDVREPDEYSQGTIPGAVHIP
jgi:rhodanese-related sulfurtransferase